MEIQGPAHLQTTGSVEGTQSVQPTDAMNETHQTNEIASNPAAGADEISISQIATELNTCGVPTKRGGTWWHKQVRRILDRFDPEENLED